MRVLGFPEINCVRDLVGKAVVTNSQASRQKRLREFVTDREAYPLLLSLLRVVRYYS